MRHTIDMHHTYLLKIHISSPVQWADENLLLCFWLCWCVITHPRTHINAHAHWYSNARTPAHTNSQGPTISLSRSKPHRHTRTRSHTHTCDTQYIMECLIGQEAYKRTMTGRGSSRGRGSLESFLCVELFMIKVGIRDGLCAGREARKLLWE